MRILFFGDHPAVFWRYRPVVSELAERGHRVQLVFKAPPSAQVSTSIPYVLNPGRRRLDGFRPVGRIVRLLADLARYSEPRYAGAAALRARQAGIVERALTRHAQEPAGRAVARRVARRLAPGDDWRFGSRVIAAAARLERSIPTSRVVDRFIAAQAPDLVLVTPAVKGPEQLEYFKSARKLGIPAGACIRTWDHLTNKGLLKWVPERVFVWNEAQRREAIELHGVPAERVVATGAQVFDEWFERRPSCSRAEFAAKVGLDPALPFLLFLGSTLDITRIPDLEVEFALAWLSALRSSGDARLREIGVMVRPHPNADSAAQWDQVDVSGFGNAVVWPRGGARPVDEDARAGFFDSLAHSAAVVGINTTAMIEAAIVGRSVLTILNSEFAQESTLHFHHLLEANGGFLYVASSLPQHLEQLSSALEENEEGERRRRAFVESFVRPHGLDRPATPILADAIEELAGVPVDRPVRGSVVLRALLTVEAALNTAALAVDLAAGSVRRIRRHRYPRRIAAKARALGRTRVAG